jgi:hypothetical protein
MAAMSRRGKMESGIRNLGAAMKIAALFCTAFHLCCAAHPALSKEDPMDA